MTFPDVETNQQSPVNLTRTKRQLAEQAIAQASAAQWEDAADTNRKLLELGPALLTLAFYLWDAVQAATPARRRDARWIWQIVLLAVLGLAVVAWNLLLR